jgi:hypothetical protein
LIDLLDLDSGAPLEVRRDVLNLLRVKAKYPNDEQVHKLFLDRFGYPTDLRT